MRSRPTVSVVLPTYNRANVLPRAIDSVLDQTYDDFELLVVDDGSTDHTRACVTSYDDPRVEYVGLPENRGASAARNAGLERARGQYVAFQDSDDEWLPDMLAAQVEVVEAAPMSVGVVYTGYVRIDNGSKTYVPGPNVETREGRIQDELAKNNFVATPGSLVRRRYLESVGGFDESLPRLQDWDLWLRLSRDYEFRHVDRPLLRYYLQPDSISRDRAALIEAKERLLENHSDVFEAAPDEVLSIHYARLGRMCVTAGEKRRARRHLQRAAGLHPSVTTVSLLAASYVYGLESVVGL